MSKKYVVRVYHGEYGCESGCCGHYIQLTDQDGHMHEQFSFSHPCDNDEAKKWARELAESRIATHWPDCADKIDWDSFQLEVSGD